jgi:dolichyl-phosphate beta-glucosyltransferase
MENKNKIGLSIIIPCYNEEKRIRKTIKSLSAFMKKKKIIHEIILIDDGSIDRTKEIIIKYASKNKNIRVISYQKNKGKGYAVKKGILNSKGNMILFSDADLSTPIEEYEKLKKWYDKGYLIAIGSRREKGSKIKKKQPFFRNLSGHIFGKIVKNLLLRDIKDSQCGFKLFNGNIARKIFTIQKINGFVFDVEILYLAKKKGIKIKEVPILWIDSAKESKVKLIKHSLPMFLDILRIWFFHRGDKASH